MDADRTAQERRVLTHESGPLLVLGGPGTGKTTLLVELVAARIGAGLDPARVLLLAPSRRSGAYLRDRVTARVGRTIREPVARTAHSFAFGLLRRDAARRGGTAPRLLAAAEQEVIITEMLAGDGRRWPTELAPALRTRAFAGELRDLMLRAVERDLEPPALARLGAEHDRPLWRSAGLFAAEYRAVTSLAHPSAYDPAELVRAAADLLAGDRELRRSERSDRSLVVVDDVAEADPAFLDLLEVLAGNGHTMIVTADPDSTVDGFRGADPQAVRDFRERFRTADGTSAPQVVLDRSYRLPRAVLSAAASVSQRLGGPGPWRVLAPAVDREGSVEAVVLASTSDEQAHVASRLRERHLVDGVPWTEMAVVVRTSTDLSTMRRTLSRHGVPVSGRADEVALWQQAPVRALLDLLGVVNSGQRPDTELVVDLLLGPLGGLDAARLAWLRRGLLVHERSVGGARTDDEVLLAVVLGEEELPAGVTEPAIQAMATTIRRGREAAGAASTEEVLWTLWESCDLAQRWQAAALAGGRDGAAADRDLDAVVALFDAAARFTDRMPGAGADAFLDHVRAQRVPGDSWSTDDVIADAVSVLTAHATKGREWDTVAVCRVQDDLWPDLRRRQSILGADDLLAASDHGRVPSATEQLTSLLSAERRLFHLAISRSSARLIVTAVDDGELRPSRLLDEMDPLPVDERPVAVADAVLSLPALVAELRAAVCDPAGPPAHRREAARQLARLVRHGVSGADPEHWYGLAEPTDSEPLSPSDAVQLSPSQIEGYLRCPLRWMLQGAGGDDGAVLRRSIGSLVHQLAFEAATHGWEQAQVWARYDELWATIDAGRGWVARRERSRVDAMVERLLAWLHSSSRELMSVEVDIDVEIAGATVRGRLDRLERDSEGGLVVVDFKTGTTPPTKAEVAENPQLGVYQWAVGAGAVGPGDDNGKPRPAGGLLVHLGVPGAPTAKEQWQPALPGSEDPDWPVHLVGEAAEGMARPTFAALVGSACGSCPVRSSCPAHPDGGRVVP